MHGVGEQENGERELLDAPLAALPDLLEILAPGDQRLGPRVRTGRAAGTVTTAARGRDVR
ncbi:MAG TPA: hypothetical protein VN783_11400 [Thermoanaerobaculia bacterium]|nr:hypothetical protein [Thermoanaerobaculia bacterium]